MCWPAAQNPPRQTSVSPPGRPGTARVTRVKVFFMGGGFRRSEEATGGAIQICQASYELKKICQDVAKDLKISIESIEVMPDHVHIFLKHPPTLPIHYIVQQIKGKSSRLLRLKFEWLKKRIPTLWTRSYFAESVGIINEDTIKKYIENQKNV